MEKKSQAATEFLLTYGWAFLVVFVAIGALVYFNVINPNIFSTGHNEIDYCINNHNASIVDFESNKGEDKDFFCIKEIIANNQTNSEEKIFVYDYQYQNWVKNNG